MSRPTYMNINLAALRHNLQRVFELAPGCSVIAMVKANAYGHGLVRIAQALEGTDALGVASLEEGIKLREAGIQQPIVLMEGLFYPDEIQEAERYHFRLVVHHWPHIEMLEQATVATPFTIWLKLNTGMHRLGFPPDQLSAVYARLQAASSVRKPIGFMTHFAEADLTDRVTTHEQFQRFTAATQGLVGPRSCANSSGILAWPETHADWVRPGLMLYGASPFATKTGLDHNLQPVMSLWSRLIAITEVKQGGRIGYGGTWTAPHDMAIGVVGVGYGDGYPQFAQSGTPVLLNGVECKTVGRVSMDMLTIDLQHQPNAKIGDPVLLWGEDLPVERVARCSQTSAYEILTRMTPRPKIEIRS